MPRGSKPGERRGGRQPATPNKRTVLTDRILAAASEHPSASRPELLAILVKDQALAADIRIAVARNFTAAPASRSINAGAARSPARPTLSTASSLAALFCIVQDATIAPAPRRKAAAEAALHFLPKTPARGWPGAVTDEYGFIISPKMAIEYRDCKLQLRHLSDGKQPNVLAAAKKAARLRARIKMMLQRLECPRPNLYSIQQWERDRERVRAIALKRQSKIVLTAEEDADEARRLARSDSLVAGPEQAAKARFSELETEERRFRRGAGRRLTRKEQADLRLLRLVYPRSNPTPCYSPDNDPSYQPLRDEPLAENGNLYPPQSRLRPAPSSHEDEEIIEFVDGRLHVGRQSQPS